MSQYIFECNYFEKVIRADVIKTYLNAMELNECVCFSCGNSSRALKDAGLRVYEMIEPDGWWEFNEIAAEFGLFDATSGHLPFPLYTEIAKKVRNHFKSQTFDFTKTYKIKTGSGETFLVMKLAYPELKLTPVRNLNAATKYHPNAPMNTLIKLIQS